MLINLADVLLMHSELPATTTGINKVRNRAGLSSLSGYSLEALKKERRYEFALEGLRWWDLMRWGDVLNVVPAKQEGVKIWVLGKEQQYSSNFTARFNKTKGFFPIPESQVVLSEGVLEQNPGWTTDDKDAYFENLPY